MAGGGAGVSPEAAAAGEGAVDLVIGSDLRAAGGTETDVDVDGGGGAEGSDVIGLMEIGGAVPPFAGRAEGGAAVEAAATGGRAGVAVWAA